MTVRPLKMAVGLLLCFKCDMHCAKRCALRKEVCSDSRKKPPPGHLFARVHMAVAAENPSSLAVLLRASLHGHVTVV